MCVEGIALPPRSPPPSPPAGPCTEGVAAKHGQERHDVVSDVDGAVDTCECQLEAPQREPVFLHSGSETEGRGAVGD